MRIEVRQEDIDKGVQRNAWSCPISRALFRETGWKWIVQENGCHIVADVKRYAVNLPSNARTFLLSFDQHGLGEPFAFEFHCESIVTQAELWLKSQKEAKP